MRLLWGFLALASCLCALVEAGLTESAALLPACGLKCTIAAIGESTCSLTNETCICTNQELISSISVCVQSSCTVKEQLSTLFSCKRLIDRYRRTNKTSNKKCLRHCVWRPCQRCISSHRWIRSGWMYCYTTFLYRKDSVKINARWIRLRHG